MFKMAYAIQPCNAGRPLQLEVSSLTRLWAFTMYVAITLSLCILNKLCCLANRSQIIKETNAAIAQVSSNMANTMTDFAAVFAKFPDQKGEMILKEILDALTFVIGIGSAFIWNDCMYLQPSVILNKANLDALVIKTAGLFASEHLNMLCISNCLSD